MTYYMIPRQAAFESSYKQETEDDEHGEINSMREQQQEAVVTLDASEYDSLWRVAHYRMITGRAKVYDANNQQIATADSEEDAARIVIALRRSNSFEQMRDAIRFALTTPGMIKGRQQLVAALQAAEGKDNGN
jgi:hypothetical protein